MTQHDSRELCFATSGPSSMLEAGGIVYQEIKTGRVCLASGVAAVQIPIQIEVFFLPSSLSIKITCQRARTIVLSLPPKSKRLCRLSNIGRQIRFYLAGNDRKA